MRLSYSFLTVVSPYHSSARNNPRDSRDLLARSASCLADPPLKARSLFLVLLALLLISRSSSNVSAEQQTSTSTAPTRTASFDIKVVLIGFDQKLIDKDYLKSNSPEMRYQLFQIPGISTNTQYSLKYEYAFPSESFTNEFVQFLQSAGKTEVRQNVIWNISYSKIRTAYYWNYTHFAVQSKNTYYPADYVEAWLVQHQSDYGGFPKNGYVLALADLSTRLPSTTPGEFELALQGKDVEFTSHFYNKTYEDSDLGIKLNRRYMTAWGGHSRFFFADLSAGPEEAAEQLPIQLAFALNSIDLSTVYGKLWLNQFLADYVWGAVYNLFTPDFVYPINYARSYKVKLVVIDNRTDITDPPITKTFDEEIAVEELQAVVPWAKVTAETKYVRTSEYPDLRRVIVDSRSPAKYGAPPDSFAVDARPVYEWLTRNRQGHIKDFMEVKQDIEEYDIPVFAFAFSGEYQFGFTYKEMVAKELDFDRTIWGVALYDLVLISHSTHDFKRGDFAEPTQPGKGFGFTDTVIHEVGHMLGLMHPFATSYDPTENFVASVMAYYPYEQSFSIFDQDALLRGQADQLLRETARLLAETPYVLVNQGDLSAAKAKTESAEKAYSTMNYEDAIKDAADAMFSAAKALAIGSGFLPAAVLRPLGVVGVFALGVLVSYIAFRRRGRPMVQRIEMRVPHVTFCLTCGKQLTWIPEYGRWYCYNCKKYQ